MAKKQSSQFTIRAALSVWVLISLVIGMTTLAAYLRHTDGSKFDPGLLSIETGPFSNLPVTLASVALTWLLAGLVLLLLTYRQINRSNVLMLAGFLLIALVYLNFLRERPDYGDYEYYIQAATRLYENQPLPPEYLYPPLWATLIEPLVSLGERGIFIILWLANLVSLFLFYFLLVRALLRYGFSSLLATLVTTVFILANTPLLRSLVYMQVNLHTLNLILLSLLLFERAPFLSALSLALAVHLKASPILLLPAFLLDRKWQWLTWFVLTAMLVGLLTAAIDGFYPYADFINNAILLNSPHEISYRDNSLDGLFAAIGESFNLGPGLMRGLVYASKLALTGFITLATWRVVKGRTFDSQNITPSLLNSLPPLLILMVLTAPIVWEHHGIFLSLSFLILMKRVETPSDWMWFGGAYLLEFLLPTFDFFPWSYGRLVAPLVAAGLMLKFAQRNQNGKWFDVANKFNPFENVV